jgi:hypothetical protein
MHSFYSSAFKRLSHSHAVRLAALAGSGSLVRAKPTLANGCSNTDVICDGRRDSSRTSCRREYHRRTPEPGSCRKPVVLGSPVVAKHPLAGHYYSAGS